MRCAGLCDVPFNLLLSDFVSWLEVALEIFLLLHHELGSGKRATSLKGLVAVTKEVSCKSFVISN